MDGCTMVNIRAPSITTARRLPLHARHANSLSRIPLHQKGSVCRVRRCFASRSVMATCWHKSVPGRSQAAIVVRLH